MNCLTCGLMEKVVERNYCLRFKKEISTDELDRDGQGGCLYFIKIIREAGEPLTPLQHMIMQDQDFRSKKMRGPL